MTPLAHEVRKWHARPMRHLDWELDFRPGGWIRAKEDARGTVVYLRLQPTEAPRGRRLAVRVAVMTSPQPIVGRSWRNVPFEAVEVCAVLPDIREILTRPEEISDPGPDALDRYFAETAKDYKTFGVIPTSMVASPDEPGFSWPIRPPESRITDDFLRDLAAAYKHLVIEGSAPARVIAESSGVPVRTVHRWISDARKRGFLPPARRGRAG